MVFDHGDAFSVPRANEPMDGVLYYGDNLDILREHVGSNTIDLIYLDPPFNSQRAYNLLFKTPSGEDAKAQVRAFEDMWEWKPQVQEEFDRLTSKGGLPGKTAEALLALRRIVGDNAMLAYIVMMAPRLVEFQRVLKTTGSIFLHCDPQASHYLKVMLDAVFGPEGFRNELIWQRSLAKGLATRKLPSNHDTILWYSKTAKYFYDQGGATVPYDLDELDEKTLRKYTLKDPDGRRYQLTSLINPNKDRPNLKYEFLGVTRVWRWEKKRMMQAYREGHVVQPPPGRDGKLKVPRQKRYLDEQVGKPLGDVWVDIWPLQGTADEYIGYPTQKPIALLNRIIKMACPGDGVVLDPFCGCGTAVDAAQRSGRRWIGIDVSMLAVDIIERRMSSVYGEDLRYDTDGKPRDNSGARALFERNPLDFERWAVSLVDGEANEKQVGDSGVDGRIRFPLEESKAGLALVSVKGGGSVGPAMVREIAGAVNADDGAQMGVLILRVPPTAGMLKAAMQYGFYEWPLAKVKFPKIQIMTVAELLDGKRPTMPTPIPPYVRPQPQSNQLELAIEASSLPTQRKRRKPKHLKPETAPAPENLGLPKVFTRIATPSSKAKKKSSAAVSHPKLTRVEPKATKSTGKKGSAAGAITGRKRGKRVG